MISTSYRTDLSPLSTVIYLKGQSFEEREKVLIAAMQSAKDLDQTVVLDAIGMIKDVDPNLGLAYVLIKAIYPAIAERETAELFTLENEIKELIQLRLPEGDSADEYIETIEMLDEERETLIAEDEAIGEGYLTARLSLGDKAIALSEKISKGEAAASDDIKAITFTRLKEMDAIASRVDAIALNQEKAAIRMADIGDKALKAAHHAEKLSRELSCVAQKGTAIVKGVKDGSSSRRR